MLLLLLLLLLRRIRRAKMLLVLLLLLLPYIFFRPRNINRTRFVVMADVADALTSLRKLCLPCLTPFVFPLGGDTNRIVGVDGSGRGLLLPCLHGRAFPTVHLASSAASSSRHSSPSSEAAFCV